MSEPELFRAGFWGPLPTTGPLAPRARDMPGAMSAGAEAKLDRLVELLEGAGSVLVCYSGGIDSAVVLAAAHRALGARAIGMTAVSASLPESEREDAMRIARELGAEHRLVESSELLREQYVANGPD